MSPVQFETHKSPEASNTSPNGSLKEPEKVSFGATSPVEGSGKLDTVLVL